jgi:hypothetical protein
MSVGKRCFCSQGHPRKTCGRIEETEMNEILNSYVWRQRCEDTLREAAFWFLTCGVSLVLIG